MGFRASIFMAVLSAIFFSLPVFAQKSGTRADTPQSQIPPSGMVLPVQPTGAELQDPTSVIVIDNAVLPPAVDVAPPTPQKQYEVEDAVFVRPDAKGKSSDEALKAAEEARKAEEARQAEEAKRLEAERQKKEAEAKAAEEAKKAEEARKAEEAKKAEEARKAEETKKAEEARKAEKAQKDEEARKAEEQKRLEAEQQKQQKADAKKAAEEARKAEKALKAEEAQKAKEARQAEKARKAEEAKQAKEARQAEKARKAEEARQAKQTKTEQPETDKQKEAELKRQEADLRRQEAELKRQEADLRQQELEILKQQETDGKVAVAGLSTNLLFDAITAVNLGVEVPIGSRFGLHAGYTFPFWTFPGETVRFNVSAFDLGARVYLHPWETRGYDLYRGWFFTVSAATGKFNLSWNGGGSQGTAIIGAVGGGYTWPVGTWWRLDVSGSAGAMICHFSDGRASRLPDPAVFKVTMTYLFHYNKK